MSVGNGPSAISVGGGYLWIANNLDSTVSALDPATFTVVSTIAVGSGPAALAASHGAIWVANQYSGTVSRISPRRFAVVGSLDVGDNPIALALGPGGVWVASSAPVGGDRGGTLVLVSTQGFSTVDPAMYNGMEAVQFPAPGLRHLGHLRGCAWPGWPEAGTRPRAPDPCANRRRSHLQFPAPPRHPLLQRGLGQG